MWKLSIVDGSWDQGRLNLDQKSKLMFTRGTTGFAVSSESQTDKLTISISQQLYACGSVRGLENSLPFRSEHRHHMHAALGRLMTCCMFVGLLLTARNVHLGKVTGHDPLRQTETWTPHRAIVRDNPATEISEAMVFEFKAKSDPRRHMC